MSMEEQISQALARAYCTPENEKKELDSVLIEAMTKEILISVGFIPKQLQMISVDLSKSLKQSRRAFSLELNIHADTLDEMTSCLDDIERQIKYTDCIGGHVFGSAFDGGIWKFEIDPDMTHDKYMNLIEGKK